VSTILHEFILAEKTDLFHTPNLRYLKHFRFFKVSPTLKQLYAEFAFRLDFHEPRPPTATGGGAIVTIYWVLPEVLAWLLKNISPTLRNPV
jgi:hypothetical protein